jgi:hypothetical protein
LNNRSTAQLGHFWIELRVKNPSNRGGKKLDDAFIKNESKNNDEDEKYGRQASEENRLVDNNDESHLVDKPEKYSDNSNKSSDHVKESSFSQNSRLLRQITKQKDHITESVSNDESNNKSSQEQLQSVSDEVFRLLEDEKELENYK